MRAGLRPDPGNHHLVGAHRAVGTSNDRKKESCLYELHAARLTPGAVSVNLGLLTAINFKELRANPSSAPPSESKAGFTFFAVCVVA